MENGEAQVQVKILGAFEMMRDGVLVTPSAPKPRQVLALLVVRGNSVVRAYQIIEELWEDRPPTSATTTLQTYVYQLRKLLQPGRRLVGTGSPADRPAAVLHTCPGGYLLSMPPDTLDAHRFEQLADRGRIELEGGDVVTAAQTLRRALRLWRGPALNDLGVGPLLQAELVRLEEARKTALEQRIDAELAMGRHQELVGELTGIVTEQPTHEGFWAKLMLALYRAGRRSDALHGYQQARNALAGDLGLEPSQELQRLHRAVLTSHPSLSAPERRPGRIELRSEFRAERPNQLPPGAAVMVGREAEAARLLQILERRNRDTPTVAIVVGSPGSGKSAFAGLIARRLWDAHSDGLLHASLMDDGGVAVDTAEVLRRFLLTLGRPADRIPESLEERAWAFRSYTIDRKLLIVLDDATRSDQLLPLLPLGAGCTMLIAARRRIAHPSIGTAVNLAPLSEEHCLELLAHALGRSAVRAYECAARDLIEICGGLPLVLRMATNELLMRPHWSVPYLVSRLRSDPRLLVSRAEDEPDLKNSVRRSRRSLSPAADDAFGWLIAIADPWFSLELAADVLALDLARTETVLEELVEVQLAAVEATAGHSTGFRYRIPRLVQMAAIRDMAEPDPTSAMPFPRRARSGVLAPPQVESSLSAQGSR